MINDHWKDELKSLPMSISVSITFMTNIYFQKKGKMVALLKQKSKITISHKPRKTYEIVDVFKRPKHDPKVTQASKTQLDNSLNFSGAGKTAGKIIPKIVEDMIKT